MDVTSWPPGEGYHKFWDASWFDTLSFDWTSAKDEKGLLEFIRKIRESISAEVDAVSWDNRLVVVGGFSQGAVISLWTGLTGERKLGVLLHCVPLRSQFRSMASAHARNVRIFCGLGHGASDPLLGTASPYFLMTELLPAAEAISRSCGVILERLSRS